MSKKAKKQQQQHITLRCEQLTNKLLKPTRINKNQPSTLPLMQYPKQYFSILNFGLQ